MATSSNKKTASGRNATKAGKTPNPRRRQVPEPVPEQEDFIGAEIKVLLSFALAVLLFLSNFHLCGAVGGYLRGLQLGIFGMVGFIAPLLLFVGTCFYFSNQGNPAAMRKLAACIGAVLALCGFAQLLFGKQPEEGAGWMEYYRLSCANGLGGGLLGGLIYGGLTSVLGSIGAFLVLLAGFLVSAVCITERSIVKAVKRQGNAAYQLAKEDMGRRREQHERRQEERRLREEKVRGVNLDSTNLIMPEGYAREEGYGGGEGYGPEGDYGVEEGYGPEGYGAEEMFEESAREAFLEGQGDFSPAPPPQADAAMEKRGPKKPLQASPLSSADVFTGKITMPPAYGEEEAPFDVDEVLTPAESAQRLVAEGISHFDDVEGMFGRPATVPAFPGPAAEPSFRGLVQEDEALGSQRGAPGPEPDREEGARRRSPFEEEEPVAMGESQGGGTGLAENASLAVPGPEKEETKERAPGGGILEIWPQEDPEEGFAYDFDAGYEEDPEEEIYLEEGPEYLGEEGYSPNGAGGFESAWEDPETTWGDSGDWEDNLINAQGGPDGGESRMGGGPFLAPGSRRVVTATGKVIDSDDEALEKRLEAKRREARESGAGEAAVLAQIKEKEWQPKREYLFPPASLLKPGVRSSGASEQEYKETAIKLQQTLRDFGVGVTVTNISCGPSVTRYELHPDQGVKVSKIVGLTDDIKLSLAAADIRIEAPIPGKSAVGIEVPNKENTTVYLRELIESEAFRHHPSRLAFAVGKDIGGQVVVADIAKMPHLLIAGATGSGKSVCINTLIMSIIFKANPDDVKLIMVDPKVVELSVYNGIPHLLIPVVTDPKKASGALNWAVAEMDDRYKKFAKYNVRNLVGYNAKVDAIRDIEEGNKPQKLPQIVIIVDELADLMMVAPGEVEEAICRLAQLARAAGIHLVIATQRPSVNVITGLIKANVPSRIAFSVSSGVDSRTIIDMYGAEKLLGKGDMLFFPSGIPKPQRVQGAFVSDAEVQQIVEFLTEQGMAAQYNPEVEKQMSAAPPVAAGNAGSGRDEYFAQAGKFIIEKEKASIGMLQRMFKIGFNRAARIMDQLAEAGVVGEEEGTKPRKVLMTMKEFEEMMENGQ